MPLWFFPALLGLCAVTSVLSGIWLLLHLQAVASLFAGRADIVPAPTRPKASRKSVILALILFNAGWIAAIAIWLLVMEGAANQVVQAGT